LAWLTAFLLTQQELLMHALWDAAHPPEEDFDDADSQSSHMQFIRDQIKQNKEMDYHQRIDKSIMHFYFQSEMTSGFRKFLRKYNIKFTELGPWFDETKRQFETRKERTTENAHEGAQKERETERYVKQIQKEQRDGQGLRPLALRSI
jgi:hypothetical protein